MSKSKTRMSLEKENALRKMRGYATAAVATAFTLLIVTYFLSDATWVRYLRAFAEAAVIGGLADWFAVTALFRHPLGLPIPHTRILPQSKDRIASTAASFVVTNFLNRDVLERELNAIDLSAKGSEMVIAKAEVLAARATESLPRILDALGDEDISRFLETQFAERMQGVSIAPIAGRIIELITSGDKHEKIVNDILGLGEKAVRDNEDVLTQLIRKEIPLHDSLPVLGMAIPLPVETVKDKLASMIAANAMKRIMKTLEEVRQNPEHEIRSRIRERIAKLAIELKESPEMRERGEEIKNDFLANSNVSAYAGQVWNEIKNAIRKDVTQPDSQILKHLETGLRRTAEQIKGDEALRDKLNSFIRSSALEVVTSNHPHIERMIRETVQRWDGKELADKLELELGRDLQFVRLNGTLVGGLLGVVLHFMVSFLK